MQTMEVNYVEREKNEGGGGVSVEWVNPTLKYMFPYTRVVMQRDQRRWTMSAGLAVFLISPPSHRSSAISPGTSRDEN